MLTGNTINRRRHERFSVMPMYSEVTARRLAEEKAESLAGHAYDISETGVRIELDEPIEQGEAVELEVRIGVDVELIATATVVWLNDPEDDPGPRRMALEFETFADETGRVRLVDYLGRGSALRAA